MKKKDKKKKAISPHNSYTTVTYINGLYYINILYGINKRKKKFLFFFSLIISHIHVNKITTEIILRESIEVDRVVLNNYILPKLQLTVIQRPPTRWRQNLYVAWKKKILHLTWPRTACA